MNKISKILIAICVVLVISAVGVVAFTVGHNDNPDTDSLQESTVSETQILTKATEENRIYPSIDKTYSVILPDGWGYKAYDSYTDFYEINNHKAMGDGSLVKISISDYNPDDDFMSCKYTVLCEVDGKYYYAPEPNGMCYDYEDKKLTEDYNNAQAKIEEFLASFKYEG